MTVDNYRRLEQAGLTGQFTSTCFAAAGDLLSRKASVQPKTYADFEAAFWEQSENGINPKRSKQVFRQVLQDLGVTSMKGFIDKRAKSPQETQRILDNARQGGWRVIVYTADDHVVGLKPTRGGWKMVGTHIPLDYPDIELETNEVYDYLAQPQRRFKGKSQPNILLIAPEKK